MQVVERAHQFSHRIAIRDKHQTYTYQALFDKASKIAHHLLGNQKDLQEARIAFLTEASFDYTAIQTEHRGSVARRMQCVHCKGITEDVMIDPFQCSHCGLNLFVRDHYSRRLAAFQGVCIDAEEPGNVPLSVELYS